MLLSRMCCWISTHTISQATTIFPKYHPRASEMVIRLSQHFTSLSLKLHYSTDSNVSSVSAYCFSIPSKHSSRAIQVWPSPFVPLKAFSKHLLVHTYLLATAQKAPPGASLVLLCAVRPFHKNGW